MFNYLYYKLFQAALKSSLKSIPNIAASAWFGGLIGINIMVINAFLAKIHIGHFLFTNPKLGGLLVAILIALPIMYYSKNKRESIIEKYSQESEKERKKGNAIVAAYVALSFLLIFAVPFFRPGKL
jgi:hypothetical protein